MVRTSTVFWSALLFASSAAVANGGDSAAPMPPPCGHAPAGVTTKKVLVTEYHPKQVEVTRVVYKTEYKEEKYTAYKCVTEPQERTRTVTYYKTVPVTRDVERTRYEYAPREEERTVTRCVVTTKPVEQMVTRCVDKGGHYETRQVACGTSAACGGRRGLFGRRSCGGCDCSCGCAPAVRTVQVYVPNYVTEQVPVTIHQRVVEHKTDKVKVMVPYWEPKKETVKVTHYECKAEPREEKYTVYLTKHVPYEAVRKVAHCIPVEEKVTVTRMVPVQVEREIVVSTGGGCADSGARTGCGGRLGGLFRRCR